MQFEVFELERKSITISEQGRLQSFRKCYPLKLSEVLTKEEQEQILNTELFYGYKMEPLHSEI